MSLHYDITIDSNVARQFYGTIHLNVCSTIINTVTLVAHLESLEKPASHRIRLHDFPNVSVTLNGKIAQLFLCRFNIV